MTTGAAGRVGGEPGTASASPSGMPAGAGAGAAAVRSRVQPSAVAWLVPLSGPPMMPLELRAKVGGLLIGRHEQCDVRLPGDADRVSRMHARFTYADRAWRIADNNSRWGTYLNGVRLDPARGEMPLGEGDLIRVSPWTFSFSTRGPARKGLKSSEDEPAVQTLVRRLDGDPARPLADDMLALLLETAAAIHAAPDERTLADAVLDAAVRGTGLPNASLLRPLDNAGTIEIVATRRHPDADERSPAYSRSLIAAASQGSVAELSLGGGGPQAGAQIAQSIVQMKIDSAICVPLVLGAGAGDRTGSGGRATDQGGSAGSAGGGTGVVAAYLYLDSRTGRVMGNRLRPNASAFCQALGRMASLALANLKRIDIERRQAAMEAELTAASAAQRWIMPRRESALAGFTCLGESRPGAYVGGDFFDLIELGPGRLAVALGDVTGHGVAASVLMTAAQGFLHASLREHGEPARAVTALNRFIHPRRSDEKFVTLWVGVFDAARKLLRYVDAGHGYAMMIGPDGGYRRLDEGDGLPVGVIDDFTYGAVEVPLNEAGGGTLVVSDGIVEQYGPVTHPDGTAGHDHFNVEGVERCLSTCPLDADPVAALFDAVERHAGTSAFADDATVVLVRW